MELLEGLFTGREVFRQNVRDVLSLAADQGWSEIMLSDVNFNDWPLGEPAVVLSLNNWSKRGRKLVLMASMFTDLPLIHPRFVRWRQTWDHLVECRRCLPKHGALLPSMVWTPEWVLHRFEGELFQGYMGREKSRRFQMREGLWECHRASVPAFPSTTLGL